MFQNYLKTALRNFNRYRGFSFLNITGLSLGLVAAWLMALWVHDELRYDRFHRDGERIYQVMNNMGYGSEKIETWSGSPAPYYRILAEDLPEVQASVACYNDGQTLLREDGQGLSETGMVATPNFFTFFTFPLLAGDAGDLFREPGRIALSAALAARLFGEEGKNGSRVMGKTVRIKDVGDFTVSGVFADVPAHSSLRFEYALSIEDLFAKEPQARDHYGNFFFQTFLRLAPGIAPEEVNSKLADVVNRRSGRDYQKSAIFLHPLNQRYLQSKFTDGRADGGRIEYVRLFSAAAIFILLIACINYMNLTTARSTRRAREIGIRKVVGASRRGLFGQFLTESVLTSLTGMGIALAAAQALLPYFNEITGKAISIDYAQPALWVALPGLALLTGLLAGSYPALVLASFRITHIFKGQVVQGFSDLNLRRGLVVLQFALSILLLVGALGVRDQVTYIRTKNLGLDKDNVLMVSLPEVMQDKYPLLQAELTKLPGVAELAGATDNPLSVGSATGDPEWEGFSEDKRQIFSVLNVDHNFLETMRIPLAAGEDFSEPMLRDTVERKYLINETAARAMGLADPVGKKLAFWGDQGRIVGVTRDFHIASLHVPIQPLILRLDAAFTGALLIRPKPGQTAGVVDAVKTLFERLAPQATVDYGFLDQAYARMYQAEQTTGRLSNLFALVAILISCLGLLGLTAFNAELRTREIGIRKVLGAPVSHLVWLLNRELGLLLAAALVLATPAAWYLLRNWMNRFAYHADLGWKPFALAGVLLMLAAALTVSFHSLRTAHRNPTETLRSE